MVNLFGYFGEDIGYQVVTRGMAEGLLYKYPEDLRLIPYQNFDRKAYPRLSNHFTNTADLTKPSICVEYGNNMSKFAGSKRIGLSQWESSLLPENWVPSVNQLDEVWTNTQWLAEVFKNSGVTVPCKNIGFGVENIFTPYAHKISEFVDDNFRFLCVGKYEEHKGYDILLRAFVEEFRLDEKVELNMSCYNPFSGVPESNWVSVMQGEFYRLGIPFDYIFEGKIRNIPIIKQRSSLPSLYVSNDAFVMPTRGDGINLPMAEAMACGLPTIGTNWSGPTEFLNQSNGYPIKFNLEPARGI